MLAVLGQAPEAPVDEATLSVRGIQRLLSRLGYFGDAEDAFIAWAEISVPLAMRPIGIVVDERGATVSPAAALDLLISQSGTRQSPWTVLLWGALGTALGTVMVLVVQRFAGTRARRG